MIRAAAALLCLPAAVLAQTSPQRFTYRGFFETRATLYPQAAPGDSGRAVVEGLLRSEVSWDLAAGLKAFGALDARTDTHRQVERAWHFDWQDRRAQRPAFSLRRASLQWHRGPVTAEVGKQFIRWGKADILNPTDRFAPRDYLSVADNDFLGVAAARVTVEQGPYTVDAVVAPRFTPSRTPLLNQRWVALPAELAEVRLVDGGARLPGRTQYGLRANYNGRGYEVAGVFYDGFHHLPLFDGTLLAGAGAAPAVRFERYHPRLRLYGGDVAVPTPVVTLKAEAAWFRSNTATADEYVLYVVQAERTWGEWMLVGGYAGEVVTERRNPAGFAPDRGFARAILARAAYTIDARRSLAGEAAIRTSGNGALVKAEYSQQLGNHWRATASFTLIRGEAGDFLGQFRRNSHGLLALRYSF